MSLKNVKIADFVSVDFVFNDGSVFPMFIEDEIDRHTSINNPNAKDLEQSLSMYHIKDVLKDVLFILNKEESTFSNVPFDLINECIKTLENEGY